MPPAALSFPSCRKRQGRKGALRYVWYVLRVRFCYGTPDLWIAAFECLRQKRIAFKICRAVRIRIGLADCRSATLFLLSREKSKKTEAVFLVASRRSGGKSKSPGPQMISICVLTLTRTSLTAEYYSAQVHLNGMERYRQVCRMQRIICAWPHSSSAIFSSIQRCVPAFSASASYASCAACSSE